MKNLIIILFVCITFNLYSNINESKFIINKTGIKKSIDLIINKDIKRSISDVYIIRRVNCYVPDECYAGYYLKYFSVATWLCVDENNNAFFLVYSPDESVKENKKYYINNEFNLKLINNCSEFENNGIRIKICIKK